MRYAGCYRIASMLLATVASLGLAPVADASLDKLSTRLAGLLDESYREYDQEVSNIITTMEINGQVEIGSPNRYFVYVEILPDEIYTLADVTVYFDGAHEEMEAWDLAAGWVLESNLELLAFDPAVKSVRCVDPPHYKTGTVTTQGDNLHNALLARNTRGLTGTGIHVGVISDGVANLATVSGTGDLPNTPPPAPVLVVGGDPGVGDEGTAMLEIIHDLAPGAELYFCPSGPSTLPYPTVISFGNAITSLVIAGCDIICDDVGWYSESYFQDGYLANLVTSLGAGTNYIHVSAAGNDANIHHQQVYTDSSPADGEHDATLEFAVPAGGVLEVWLQWNDRFQNNGNYDIVLEDKNTGNPILNSPTLSIAYNRSGIGQGNTGEYASFVNYGTQSIVVDVRVKYVGGGVNHTLEMFFETFFGTTLYGTTPTSMSAVDAIIGHTAEPSVVAVGAVDHSTPTVIESFSSQGPVTHIDGVYNKPDVVATDNVSVSTPSFAPSGLFAGTSAAAPHVAGILALAWEWSPEVSPSGLVTAMTASASDLGTTGLDPVFGSGFPDADATAGALNLPPALITQNSSFNAAQQVEELITGISVNDPDAGSNNLSLTLTATNGTLNMDVGIPSGVTPSDVTGNSSPILTVSASASAINTTLSSNNGLTYRSTAGITGPQSISLNLSDNGNSGFGGPLSAFSSISLILHNDSYEAWARDNFGSQVDDLGKEATHWGVDANPESDYYTNRWEFFLGIDPNAVDTTIWFNHTISGSNFTFTFPLSHEVDPNAYDVRYTNDLTGSWSSVPGANWTIGAHPSLTDSDQVTITRTLTTQEFIRLTFDPNYAIP